jgi:RNA polymerase sigma factor (sigma-70 family)
MCGCGCAGDNVVKREDAERRDTEVALFQEHYEEVRQYLARHVKCPHDVDDLTQSVFASLYGSHGRPRDPRRYILTTARHALYAYWRRRRLHRRTLEKETLALQSGDDSVTHIASASDILDPADVLADREMQWIAASTAAGLPKTLAEALRLKFAGDLTLGDAAHRAGCTREAMKKRLRRAALSLKRLVRIHRGFWS